MLNSDAPLEWFETSAILYLVAPTFLFLATFTRIAVAIPGCAFIAYCAYRLVGRKARHDRMVPSLTSVYFLVLACAWIWLSGGIGPLHQNSDWTKHYAIVNALAQYPWPVEMADQGGVLRYSLGWYLVPALILKALTPHVQNIALSLWSVLGVFLFFRVIAAVLGDRASAIVAPLVFVIFGGADLIGYAFTGYQHGPIYHLQWWSGWISYPASTTSVFWTPQHAIPSWIGIGLLMRQRANPRLIPYIGLVFSAILLWSPFSVMGLAPFLLLVPKRYWLKSVFLEWKQAGSVLLIALPIASYLAAGANSVPHGFIWTLPCTIEDGPCFSWPAYARFLLVEIGLPLAVLLFACERYRKYFWMAIASLCVIPLYKIGVTNDFGMRASIPALSVLPILLADAICRCNVRLKAAIVLTLLIGLPTSAGEIARGFKRGPDIDVESSLYEPWARAYLSQYISTSPIFVLRSTVATH
ncbi:hypothetical protein AB4Y44_17115 [Paraburkholderia sp. BR10937]|uniref:hypothetical protein n=1 Tax=Paraburkholderia sp. BR10937 TaxID=3236994 RepID=UPI0034D20BEA